MTTIKPSFTLLIDAQNRVGDGQKRDPYDRWMSGETMSIFYSIGILGEPLFASPRHSHHTWEICLYVQGEGIITVGTEQIPFRPGSIICLPPEIPHEERSTAGCNLFFIHTDVLYDHGVTVPVFHDAQDRRFQQLVMLLHQEFLLREPGWQETTQQLFQLLLTYLQRWTTYRASPLVEQLQHVFLQEFRNPAFAIGEIMGTMPMSADHLRKLFEEATGQTPIQYLTNLRMNEAKQLLQTGAFSIKEVAWRSGYADPYYFSRIFYKTCGLRPSDYAKKALFVPIQGA